MLYGRLTDYLAWDVYFKVRYSKQYLVGALVRNSLAESVELEEGTIREVIKDLVDFGERV